MKRLLVFLCVTFVLFGFAIQAYALSIVWDQSPATVGGIREPTYAVWSNVATGQNFADIVEFSIDTWVEAMDLYINGDYANVGDPTKIRIRSDNSGVPGSIINEFEEIITIKDSDGVFPAGQQPADRRIYVDFSTPVFLSAGRYWFGMSGVPPPGLPPSDEELSMFGIRNASGPLLDNRIAIFNGTTFWQFTPEEADMPFRLYGTSGPTPIPEPSTILLLGSGLIGLVGFRRKFKK